MDRKLIPLVFALFFFSYLTPAKSDCDVHAFQRVVQEDSTQVHLLLTLFDDAELDQPSFPETARLLKFREELSEAVPLRGRDLIFAQVESYHKMPILQKRLNLIANAQVGGLSSATCLENYLFSHFVERFYSRDFPTEFQAYVLSAEPGFPFSKVYRIYFSAGDGRVWGYSPPTSELILENLQKDVSAGWKYEYHLHSHPFYYHKEVGYYGGIVAPSDSDLNTYLGWFHFLGMREARITNGFDTFVLTPDQLPIIMQTFPSEDSQN
ncbi:MAG: hypothetical protein AB7H97_11885 [Pseudobdellovibrionaceae bacterium]